MTPEQIKAMCTHQPYYQKGCLACDVRYVKFLRPSREKQEAFLSRQTADRARQIKEILRKERECS